MHIQAASLALVGIAALAPAAAAQTPQPIGRPQAEFAEPFTRVTAMRELADGRVIVADQREKLIQLVDLRTGAAQRISREGSGPGEYALPTGLYALPNDQSLLIDLQNRRYLRIDGNGKVTETISPPQLGGAPSGGGAMRLGGLVSVRGVDRQGRLYYQDAAISMNGAPSPDSLPIVRWMPGTTKIDTVAWLAAPKTTVTTSGGGGGGGGMRITMGMSEVWAPAEAWSVTDEGRIARVTPEPYRVIWYDGARRASPGPVVAYTPLRVTEADKAEYREAQKANPPTMMMFTTGGGGGTSAPVAPQLPEPTFAETKPAFTGSGAVLATPDGEVWVLRTRRAGDNIPVYDVFDPSGRLVRKVSLAARSRVVGFGKATVYVARMDEDDLEYLQRFSRPAVGEP